MEQTYLEECLTLDEQFACIAAKLSEKYNLALLSNDISEWSTFLRGRHDLNRFFQEIIISADVGHRKPSETIFEIVLKRMGCIANDCVFIDDNCNNLVPAANMGMKTIFFNRNENEGYNGCKITSLIQLPKILTRIFEK